MAQKLIKIGTSTGITIPKRILDEMRLKAGDTVTVEHNKEHTSLVVRKENGESSRQDKIARLTHDFVERYRSDLEALADK